MRPLRLLLFLPVLLLLSPGAHAQETDTTQLPEIAPREIEIRSEREIALPALERQPLTGFASPPDLPAVPADRAPYVGTYTYPLNNLPESLPLPQTVSAPMQPTGPATHGFLEGGTGRYFSRFFEGRLGQPLSSATRLSVHGAYTGTEADPDDDVAEARVRLEHAPQGLRVDGELYGAVQRYALHGAHPPTPDTLDTPSREGSGAGGSVAVTNTGTIPAAAEMRYDYASYNSALGTTDREFTQQQFELHGTATVPVRFRPHVDATYRRSWLGGDPADDTAFDLEATGTVSFLESDSSRLEVGLTALAYGTPAAPAVPSAGTAEATYFAPTVRAEWWISDALRLHAHTLPRLGDSSLDQLYATNPYVEFASSLQPTLETTHAEAGLTYTPGPVRIVAAAGYRYAPTYRHFVLSPQQPGRYGNLYEVRYDAARILEGRGEIALQGTDGLQASLAISVRDGALGPDDADIPNFAAVTADAMLGVSFAGGDGFVKAHGRLEGPRDASLRPGARRADTYASVDLEGSYALGPQIEVVARAENLSFEAPVRWARYPRPPAQVSAGLRLTW
jgi:hypothetical protein